MAGRRLVVAPHPDDAVLSAWTALRESPTPWVATVCTGMPPAGLRGGFDEVLGSTDSASLVTERLAEDAAVLDSIGAPWRRAGLLDGQYRSEPLDQDVVADFVGRTVEEAGADTVLVPAGIGAHPDHLACRDASFVVAAALGLRVTLYAELPYAVWAGWPHWVTGTSPRPYLDPDARWRRDLAGVPGGMDRSAPRVRRLDDTERAAKLSALRGYRTQWETLNAGPLDRLVNPAVIGFELWWDVVGFGGTTGPAADAQDGSGFDG